MSRRHGSTESLRCALAMGLALVTTLVVAGAPPAARAQGLQIRIPEKPFSEMPAPPAPDYRLDASWAALPQRRDAADVVPDNDAFGDRQASAPVDVFYIHPTTYRGIEYWNQPLDDAKTNDWTDESVIARQAAVFNACCRVYAPRYRQAASAAVYAPPAKQPLLAYDLAWGDVRTAFLHYLRHWNRGRPFIIAGHSQGAAHVQRWLEEFGKDRRLRAQLVAAYAIGIGFAAGTLQRLPGDIRLCATPSATGCLVTWNSFASGGNGDMFVKPTQARYAQKFGTTDGQAIQCVNPLTFDLAHAAAPASWNLGALPARPGVGLAAALKDGVGLAATEAGRIGARCEGGVLWVDALPAEGYAIVALPGGMLHFNDFDLYYQNIRLNAVVRSEAWLASLRTRR
jgi:hypothetical protein